MDMDWDDESGLHDPPPPGPQDRSELTTYNPPTIDIGLNGEPGPNDGPELEVGERNEPGLYDPSEVETGARNALGQYDLSEAETGGKYESGPYVPSEVETGERNEPGPFDPAEVEVGERKESGPYDPSEVEIRERDEPESYGTPEAETGNRDTFGTYDPSEVEIGPKNGIGFDDSSSIKTGEDGKLGSRDLSVNQDREKSGPKEYDPAEMRGGEEEEEADDHAPHDPTAAEARQGSAPVPHELSEAEKAARNLHDNEAGADGQPGVETKDGSDSENNYQVQKLVGKRVRRRGKRNVLEYLVRWSGYAPKFDQWMPITDLSNTLELIQDYEAANQADEAAPRGEKRKADVANSPRKQGSVKKQRLEGGGNSTATANIRQRGRPTKQRPAIRSVRSVQFGKRGRSGKKLPGTRSGISQKGEAELPRTQRTPREAVTQNGTVNTPTKRRGLRKTSSENVAADTPVRRGRAGKQAPEHDQVANGTPETETPDNRRKRGRTKDVSKEDEEPDTPRTRGSQTKNLLVGINAGTRKTGKVLEKEKVMESGTRGGSKKQLTAIHPPINRKRAVHNKVASRQLRSRK